jgi:hypothetical protein
MREAGYGYIRFSGSFVMRLDDKYKMSGAIA